MDREEICSNREENYRKEGCSKYENARKGGKKPGKKRGKRRVKKVEA